MNIKKIFHFGLGTIGSAVLSLLTLPLLAWVFSPEVLGRLNIAQTMIPIVINVIFLGLDQAYVREFHEVKDKHKLFATSVAPSHLLITLMLIPAALFSSELAKMLYGISSPLLTWATMLSLILTLQIREWSLLARMEEKALVFSMSQIIPKLSLVLGIIALIVLNNQPGFDSVFLIFLFSLFSTALYLGFATWRSRPRLAFFQIDSTLIRGLLRFGIPTMAASLAYVAMLSAGTISLRIFSSFTELGQYSLAISVGAIVAIVQTIFSIVWSPIIYKAQTKQKSEQLITQALPIATLLFGVLLTFVGFISWIVPSFVPESYAPVGYLMIGTCLVPLIYLVKEITSVGISIKRKMAFGIYTYSVSLITVIILNVYLTPKFGAIGAVSSIVVAMWLLLVLNTEISAKVWYSPQRTTLHFIVGTGVALAIYSMWSGYAGNFCYLIAWPIYLAIVIIFQRKTFVYLISSAKK